MALLVGPAALLRGRVTEGALLVRVRELDF